MSSNKNVIEFEGVEFKCFSLIEYSSLIELLKLLAKKYKSVDDKISILDQRIIEKDKRISELEIMLKGISQSTDNKFPSIAEEKKEIKSQDKSEEKNLEKSDENDNIDISQEKKLDNENNGEVINTDENEKNKNQDQQDSKLNLSQEKKEENNEIDNNNKEQNQNQNLEQNEIIEENNNQLYPNQVPTMKLGINNTDFNSGFNLDNLDNNNNNGEANKELFSKILKKLKQHEKQINDLLVKNNEFLIINKSIKLNKNEMEELEKQIKNLKNNISDINNKMLGYNDDLEKIKVKVTDFDVYDLFKGMEGDVDLDAAKLLIKNLENKMMKKFEIYDERNKQLDKDMFKLQEDVKNSLAIVDGMKTKTDRNTENLEELSYNYHNKMSEVDYVISKIQRQIEVINEKIEAKPDFSNIKKDFEYQLKDLEKKLHSKFDLFLNNETTNTNNENDKENSSVAKSEILSLIKELRKRIGELEKFTATNFEKINIDDIKKRISKLENETSKKAGKYELQELGDKLRSLDEFVKDLNFKQDTLQQFTEKVRMDLAQIIKKIEFLSGEYSKLAFNKNEDGDGLNNVDITRFLDVNIFNDNKRDVNNKFEKIRLGFEDLSREIDEILNKLSHTPTDKDFSEFQNIIKSLIDELKLNSNKKYADKIEISKTIKFLETQIRALHDAFIKKNEAGDNWLLAKKPINNYVCASCEANIKGELDKRTDFVPWNRYPQRDDKAYRIGHGFSRMLQMVNEDIIKNAGEKGGYSSDEDNRKTNLKNNNNINGPTNASVKLPKVTRKKPLLSGMAITEPNNNSNNNNMPMSPYDGVDNGENNDINKIQIMRVIRKSKNQNDNLNSNRDNSTVDIKKNNDINNNVNSNENEN